jgi:hypothetical protein
MSNQITQNIKNLTKSYYDTQLYIEQLNKKINLLREQKKQVESTLINEIYKNGLQNQAITYQGKKIYIGQENVYDNLSFKFLEECLSKLYKGNIEKVKEIIKFIKSQRNKQNNKVIKIT